jgi:hypothetical protein
MSTVQCEKSRPKEDPKEDPIWRFAPSILAGTVCASGAMSQRCFAPIDYCCPRWSDVQPSRHGSYRSARFRETIRTMVLHASPSAGKRAYVLFGETRHSPTNGRDGRLDHARSRAQHRVRELDAPTTSRRAMLNSLERGCLIIVSRVPGCPFDEFVRL